MTDLQNRFGGDNPARPEISPMRATRLDWMRDKIGDIGSLANVLCDLALGSPVEGDTQ